MSYFAVFPSDFIGVTSNRRYYRRLSDVRVRMMGFNRSNGLYEFTTEGENSVTIYWNPDKLELDTPSNTGHQDSPNQ
ncbi:S-type pyocin domain-containing protein [Yersinia ruckeri]|nr:S-type pyocin domain-containing protein [Yersinia ruckeri]